MNSLNGKLVCITGASSGIGAACARAFARLGARLLLAARRIDRLEAMTADLERVGAAGVRSVELDVRDAEAVRRTIEALPADWTDVEVLVNNAGLSRGLDKLHEGEVRDWEEMIDTNVRACCTSIAPSFPSWSSAAAGPSSTSGRSPAARCTPEETCTARRSMRSAL